MLKRTLVFTNPARLSLKDKQLIVLQDEEKKQVPIEDIGIMLLEHQQITVSLPVLNELVSANVSVIFCDHKHMPHSLLFPLDGNHIQNEIYREQLNASEPLKKQLWKQTVEAKIMNQAKLLEVLGKDGTSLKKIAREVKSNDSTGREGVAAKKYWNVLIDNEDFYRDRYGPPPNNLLNYGYMVLRAAVARALTGSGLLPTMGIHHHNRYNPYCLADDIIEPFRPFVDAIVYYQNKNQEDITFLTQEIKAELLKVLTMDVHFKKINRPLLVGLSQTTASLAKCFTGKAKTIDYPSITTFNSKKE